MVIMLSKFRGVPTTMTRAKMQFEDFKEDMSKVPATKNRWLVLKIQKIGMYKNLPLNYFYETKPKCKYIKCHRF